LHYPEDRTLGGFTRIIIDPYSGNILSAIDSRRAPAGYRLVNLNRALHTGDILGIPSKGSAIAGQSNNAASTADGIGNVDETTTDRGQSECCREHWDCGHGAKITKSRHCAQNPSISSFRTK
jgi:hypothetical protein